GPVPLAQQDAHPVVEPVVLGDVDKDVEVAVVIDIAHGQRLRLGRPQGLAHEIIFPGGEGAIAVAQQHAHGGTRRDDPRYEGLVVGRDDVQVAVVVQVGQGQGHRVRPDGQGGRVGKQAVVEVWSAPGAACRSTINTPAIVWWRWWRGRGRR